MKLSVLIAVLLPIVGCGGVSTPGGGGGGDAGDAASKGDAAPKGDAAHGDDGPAKAGPVAITISASCPAFTPCGGDVVGTWAAAAGCVDDPLATSKSLCPALVVNSETASVEGAVTFTSDFVTRGYTVHYAMDVTIPASCLTIATCAQIQTAYQAYLPDTSCADAPAGACHCQATFATDAAQASMYSTSDDEVVTTSGDRYAYCVSGNTLQYRHVSGPSAEIGSYTLRK
jgi:hypothetical protein